MAWTAPMTAVANAVWTSAQFNTHVRDNLLASETANVSAALQIPIATGVNTVGTVTAGSGTVATQEATSSGTFTDLATSGPSVTVTTRATALVHMAVTMSSGTANGGAVVSFAVSGATTIASSDTYSLQTDGHPNVSQVPRVGVWTRITGLNAGSNTFKLQYRTDGTSCNFIDRHIIVLPL